MLEQKTKSSLTQQSSKCIKTNLDEANFFGIAAEALPAAHESILSDQPVWVSANPANPKIEIIISVQIHFFICNYIIFG